MWALAYLAFVVLCTWGGYYVGSWFKIGLLTAVFGTVLGLIMGRLIYFQLDDWWESRTPVSGWLKPRQRLQKRLITVDQAEANYFEEIAQREVEANPERRARLAKPFGFCNAEWEQLKAMMQEGDELWEVCNSKWAWKDFTGYHGILLIRHGETIADIILKRN